jgi:hypothetical protein
VETSPHTVEPLNFDRLPWLVKLRLRKIKKKHRTGLLLYAIIRTPTRSMSADKPSVAVRESDRELCACSSYSRLPKWVPLEPGAHELYFHAVRWKSRSSFDRRIDLKEGDVLVVICEPIQPAVFYAKRPSVDTWYLGVIDSAGGIRPIE